MMTCEQSIRCDAEMYLMVFHSSFDRMLCFGGVVASAFGNGRDLILGMAATSLLLVCIRKNSAGRLRDIHTADCS